MSSQSSEYTGYSGSESDISTLTSEAKNVLDVEDDTESQDSVVVLHDFSKKESSKEIVKDEEAGTSTAQEPEMTVAQEPQNVKAQEPQEMTEVVEAIVNVDTPAVVFTAEVAESKSLDASQEKDGEIVDLGASTSKNDAGPLEASPIKAKTPETVILAASTTAKESLPLEASAIVKETILLEASAKAAEELALEADKEKAEKQALEADNELTEKLALEASAKLAESIALRANEEVTEIDTTVDPDASVDVVGVQDEVVKTAEPNATSTANVLSKETAALTDLEQAAMFETPGNLDSEDESESEEELVEVTDKATDPKTPDVSMMELGSIETVGAVIPPETEVQSGPGKNTVPDDDAAGDGRPYENIDSPERPRKQATVTLSGKNRKRKADSFLPTLTSTASKPSGQAKTQKGPITSSELEIGTLAEDAKAASRARNAQRRADAEARDSDDSDVGSMLSLGSVAATTDADRVHCTYPVREVFMETWEEGMTDNTVTVEVHPIGYSTVSNKPGPYVAVDGWSVVTNYEKHIYEVIRDPLYSDEERSQNRMLWTKYVTDKKIETYCPDLHAKYPIELPQVIDETAKLTKKEIRRSVDYLWAVPARFGTFYVRNITIERFLVRREKTELEIKEKLGPLTKLDIATTQYFGTTPSGKLKRSPKKTHVSQAAWDELRASRKKRSTTKNRQTKMTTAESIATVSAKKLYKTSLVAGTRRPAISGTEREAKVEARRQESLDRKEYTAWGKKKAEVLVEYEAELARLARLKTQCDYMCKLVGGIEEWESDMAVSQVSEEDTDLELQEALHGDLNQTLQAASEMTETLESSQRPSTSTGIQRPVKRPNESEDNTTPKKRRTEVDTESVPPSPARSIVVIQEVSIGRTTAEGDTQTAARPTLVTRGVNTRRWTYFQDHRLCYNRQLEIRHEMSGTDEEIPNHEERGMQTLPLPDPPVAMDAESSTEELVVFERGDQTEKITMHNKKHQVAPRHHDVNTETIFDIQRVNTQTDPEVTGCRHGTARQEAETELAAPSTSAQGTDAQFDTLEASTQDNTLELRGNETVLDASNASINPIVVEASDTSTSVPAVESVVNADAPAADSSATAEDQGPSGGQPTVSGAVNRHEPYWIITQMVAVGDSGIAPPYVRIVNFDPLPGYTEPQEEVVILEIRGSVHVRHANIRHSQREIRMHNDDQQQPTTSHQEQSDSPPSQPPSPSV